MKFKAKDKTKQKHKNLGKCFNTFYRVTSTDDCRCAGQKLMDDFRLVHDW
jgi:hypothetical protein